jgi:hypothetical protein
MASTIPDRRSLSVILANSITKAAWSEQTIEPPGEAARLLIDGPLSNMSVLVRIPAVRELVEDLLSGHHDERKWDQWSDAFDATEVTT